MSTREIEICGKPVPISAGAGVSPDQFNKFVGCRQFKRWVAQQKPHVVFHEIVVDVVFMFGPNPGLLFITVELTHGFSRDTITGEKKPLRSKKAVFIRGGAICIYLRLRSKQTGKVHVIYLRQPRFAVGDTELPEIVAGMMDGETGTLASSAIAAKELKEEAGIEILPSDLRFMGTMLPSPGVCDEWIDCYVVFLEADDDKIMALSGIQTGEAGSDEQIIVCLADVEEFKTMLLDGRIQDAKAMCAMWYLENKIARGYYDAPSRFIDIVTVADKAAAAAAAGGGAEESEACSDV